jgi:F-type H+-transporting ATPase subunit beta
VDLEHLVRSAAGGDVRAFVEHTRRFQHFAGRRPGGLSGGVDRPANSCRSGGISRLAAGHRAPPCLPRRRKRPPTLPLAKAAQVADEDDKPDDLLERRQRATSALAAIAALPASLREAATLFFVHDWSHQDIATFLNLPVATVNNRLHAARTHLKRTTLTKVTQTLHTHGLTDDFANRIGRLIEVRGSVVDALTDPTAMPDLLAELELSDEANRRGVSVQVVQRRGAGIVRGTAARRRPRSPVDVRHNAAVVAGMAALARAPVLPRRGIAQRRESGHGRSGANVLLLRRGRPWTSERLLWTTPVEPGSRDDQLLRERALRLQNYSTQPFFCAEPYTRRSGVVVSAAEAVRTCRSILDGQHDDVPVESFDFSGGMKEIRGNTGRTLSFGPVTL